jgi:acyl-CoA reductase-like NAD-dependent aldehyde dehydrogenase
VSELSEIKQPEKLTAVATLKLLETAFNEDNHPGFIKIYKKYFDDNFKDEFDARHSSTYITGQTIPALNPMFGGENFYLKTTKHEDGEEILKQSKAAHKIYSKMGTDAHLDFLKILQKHIERYSDDIKLTITADMGKPIDLTNAEVDSKGKAWFDHAQKHAEKIKSQLGPKYGKNSDFETVGAGVVQVIGAFNYPFALTIPGIVGALATGNSLVVSTPEKAPNWVFPLMKAANEAVDEFTVKHKETLSVEEQETLKKGLIQYSVGREPTISIKADLVHFVGSDTAGKKIKEAREQEARLTNEPKPTILELGGSNVVAVMNSAVETDNAADSAKIKKIADEIYGGFGPATGQRCTAPRVLLVQDGAALKIAEQLKAVCTEGPKVGNGGIGNPFTSGTKMGPLVDSRAYESMKEIIKLAGEFGAEVHGNLDANKGNLPLPKGGRWVNPVIIDWSNAEKDPAKTEKIYKLIKKDEVFAPLVHIVHPVKTIEQVIEKTNELDTHNLASAIYTENKKEKERFFEETFAVSKTHNGPPKDKSPDGPHGHPGELQIGGEDHYKSYMKLVRRNRDQEQELAGAGAAGYRR